MVTMNDEMKKIISVENNQEADEKILYLLQDIVSKTKIIKDCVIYDEEGIKESDVDFESVLKVVGDLTGYEVGCNEFWFEKGKIAANQYLSVAEECNRMLKRKYKNRNFVVYICESDRCIEIRFHTDRAEESSWLVEDLNLYNNPILRCTCE